MRLVLASNNAASCAELQALFAPLGIELRRARATLGIAEAEEPHRTFVENALAKARHAARAAGVPAIADDSGLCVDALGGAPGVDSAHFAPSTQSSATTAKRCDGARTTPTTRCCSSSCTASPTAAPRFVSALVALRTRRRSRAARSRSAAGTARSLRAPRGAGGFGYDPLMFIPAFGRTVAELDAAT